MNEEIELARVVNGSWCVSKEQLDYFVNLEKENYQLKADNFKLQARADKYKCRIDKAIEYIKRAEIKDGNSKDHSLYVPNILEILKGEI